MTLPLLPVSGRAYFSPGSYSTLLTVAGTLYAVPFVPGQFIQPSKVGVNVTTAGVGAGADVKLAIYDSVNGRPGNLVADLGAVAALIATGEFSVTLSSPVKLGLWPGKVYWLASLWGTAATTQPTVAALDTGVVPQDIAAALGVANLGALPSSIATAAVAVSVTGQTYANGFSAVAPAMTAILNGKAPLVGLLAS